MTNREMDLEVAAKVMGYTIYHYDKDHADNCYYMLMDANFEQVAPVTGWRSGERKTEAEAWEDCPRFSTDMTAAWMVAERMRDAGWTVETLSVGGRLCVLPYACSMTLGEGERGVNTKGETMPEAICRAALVVMRVNT